MKKRFFTYLGALLVLASTVFALNGFDRATSAATVDNGRDCDTVNVIYCGAHTKQELLRKYDQNSYKDIPRVFRAFGISRADLANGGYVNGIVWRDGRVTVDGKVVATNAMTAGRWHNPKSDMQRIANTDRAYKMSPRHFVTDGQTALVRMQNGKFQFAVIKSCGNPVTATPKVTPKEQPKPVYKCEDLTKQQLSRTQYRFTATASAANGAKVVRYKFDFGDGTSRTTTSRTVNHTYAEAGAYTVRVTAVVRVDGSLKETTSSDCVVRVNVPEKPEQPENVKVCNPETGEIITVREDQADDYAPVDSPLCEEQPEEKGETPTTIAKTGPAEFIGGTLGLGALTAAGYHYGISRRRLLEQLLNR